MVIVMPANPDIPPADIATLVAVHVPTRHESIVAAALAEDLVVVAVAGTPLEQAASIKGRRRGDSKDLRPRATARPLPTLVCSRTRSARTLAQAHRRWRYWNHPPASCTRDS